MTRILSDHTVETEPLEESKATSSKAFGIFSKPSKRPKTADSAKTGIYSLSSRSRMGAFSYGMVEDETLPSFGISAHGTSLAYSNSLAYQSGRRSSVSNPPIRLDHQPPTPSPDISVRTTSQWQNTLSVPSTLATSLGTHFPGHKWSTTPIKSVLSSNSSNLPSPARDAVTDPRMIVYLNEAGMVASGTLEGFAQHLITHSKSGSGIV